MSLEQSVREACAGLRSERVTERRRSAETLKGLLVPVSSILSANQLRCSGLSWDDVFNEIHEFTLKECEKFETNRTFNTSHQLCSSLLYETVIGANKGKSYIKSERLIEACLQILQSPRLTQAFGEVYINLLYRYVMPFEYYLQFITPQTWEDLLNYCVIISGREQGDILITLRLILRIMQKGAMYCHFVISARDVIPNLRKHYTLTNQENKIQEVLLSIGIELLKILSSESRLTMCEFTEAVIPGLLKCYEQNADIKKKMLLFNFLELAVLVHHPRGRLQCNSGSLAHEWPTWTHLLQNIAELVLLEGNFLERIMSEGKFKYHHGAGKWELCRHYVQLAAYVFYQTMQTSNSRCAAESQESPAKRARLYDVNTFNDLILKVRELPMPWISVIAAYVRLYFDAISMMDCAVLLSVLENYISCTNNKINWNDFGASTCKILEKLAGGMADESVSLIIQTLWNSCVRYSSVDTSAHCPIHMIIQTVMELDLVDKKDLPQLLKLYNEGAMMVTSHSVATLNRLFRKYDSILDDNDLKLNFLNWLKAMRLDTSNGDIYEELFLHLIAKENVYTSHKHYDRINDCQSDLLFRIAFENNEDNILASEFETSLWKETHLKEIEKGEEPTLHVCFQTKSKVDEYLCSNLKVQIEKYEKDEIVSIDLVNNLKFSLSFIDKVLKYNICNTDSLENENLWIVICECLDAVVSGIGKKFNRVLEQSDKALILKSVISLLSKGYHQIIESRLRTRADEDFFRVLYEIINKEDHASMQTDQDVFDIDDVHNEDLKEKAIELCALYCKNDAQFREDVLELILDPKLYNFALPNDVKYAFHCIDILCERHVIQKPIESLFRLMQAMCKSLFRNSEATIHILNVLYTILEDIGALPSDTIKNNCIIMLRGYLQRCQNAYYPPRVAALVYRSIARIEQLKKHQQWNNTLIEAMVKGLESPVHSIRLYSCYVLKEYYENMSENNLKIFLSELVVTFEVEVTTESREMLKDEAVNRTSTVLHCVSALALTRPMWMTKLFAALIEIAKVKSIDRKLIAKVLDQVIHKITGLPTEEYLRNNLLPLLYYWLNMKISIADISYWCFGYKTIEEFIENHMNWLIPMEVLCKTDGIVGSSSILPVLKNSMNIGEDVIINNCFCNIMVLSLPHSVHEKYEVPCPTWMQVDGLQTTGIRMFKTCMEWFGADRISTLYEEHFGSLILLSTMMLVDPQDVAVKFRCSTPSSLPESYNYSLQTYDLVLKYFGEIVGGSVMQNICENMPLAISNILLNLWSQIETENVLEAKLFCLHRYVVLFERIPLKTQLDGYICNFMCCSLMNTLRACHGDEKKDQATGMVCRALNIVLAKMLPEKLSAIDKLIPQLISTLIIAKQENNCNELEELFSFLLNDMEYCLKNSIDLVDAASAFTQGRMDSCHSSQNFMTSLKTFIPKLTCYSLETLNNMKTILKTHKTDLFEYCESIKHLKGFSEDCQESVIHCLINSLTNIAADSKDDKCVLAACDCLGEIGPCNLKTLVMSTPESQDRIVCVNPSQYLSLVALQTLSANVFDERPRVIQKTAKALKSLLSFKEGNVAMELGDFENHHLQPFISKRKNQSVVKCVINDDHFNSILKTKFLWIPNDNETHEDWLKKIMSSLTNAIISESNYVSELYEVCKLKPSSAEKLVPPLFGLVVSCANEAQMQILSVQLTAFFQYFYEKTYYSTQDPSGFLAKENSHNLLNIHKCSVETMLCIVDFVRIQRLQYQKRRSSGEIYNYLEVNYLAVAWAACLAGHSMAAVLYGELWCLAQHDGTPPDSPEATARLQHGDRVQNMFRKSYVAIGESDSVYGCGTGHLSNEGEKLNHILRMGHFSDALLMHDVALGRPDAHVASLQRGLVRSLSKSGLYHIAVQYMKSLPGDDLDDVKFDCYSNLGDWSLIVEKSSLEVKTDDSISKLESVIKAYQYSCLKDCLTIDGTDGYETRLNIPLAKAKLAVANFLRKSNIKNCRVVYNITSRLQLFQEIEEYYNARCMKQPVVDLLRKWDTAKLVPCDDFKYVEPVLSQRSLILEHAAKLDSLLVNDVIDMQLKYAELAMVNGCRQLSSRLVAMAQRLRPGGKVSLVDGQVLWANGHTDIALHLIKSIIDDASCSDRVLRANALRLYGSWMMELRYESSRDILDKYLKGSLNTLGEGGHIETQLKVFLDLAKFADSEYKQVLTYTKSSIFENKVKCMQNMRGTACSIKELQSQQPISKDEQRAFHTNDRLSKYEEAEITSTYKEKKRFLDLAMKYYLLTLSKGELSDLSIFRVISLWIDNPTNEFDNDEDTFEYLLNAVPSRKYLPVLPQIAPRLTKENTAFASFLSHTLKRCASDHPHHTLPTLFALSNSHKDLAFLSSRSDVAGHKKNKEEPRVTAARDLIKQLAATEDVLRVMIHQMDQMNNALISLAYYKSVESTQPGSRHALPRSEPLVKLKNLDSVLVPVANLPISKDCLYADISSVVSFSKNYTLVGGINAPKKMSCKGSDGTERTILLKGEDDLRQDAVMQQVFTIVNSFLEMNQETSRRKLIIRTYKVVPLSRRSGVLEWCEGTDTIGSYLVGNTTGPGAHVRYRPKDITPSAARSLLAACGDKAKSKEHKLSVFRKILSQFKPVFHHFFTESFLAPVTWYERRLAYTKSVATSSMVGYMLGLGDRHVQNILIDKKTAEVVHIDFGIAFDQGRALPTPETVPFRLTQDIVAGFGACGVDGVFRRCCEKTLQLLQDQQETLLTILEVLLCDPLYTWTVSAEQAKRKQNIPATPRDSTLNGAGDSGGGANTGAGGPAERALLAVRSKLCGTEGSAGGGMAVPGIVARLLQHATDHSKLAQLYVGWQPYI